MTKSSCDSNCLFTTPFTPGRSRSSPAARPESSYEPGGVKGGAGGVSGGVGGAVKEGWLGSGTGVKSGVPRGEVGGVGIGGGEPGGAEITAPPPLLQAADRASIRVRIAATRPSRRTGQYIVQYGERSLHRP